MITFQIPYFESFLVGRGEVISKDACNTKVKVTEGFMAGKETEISNLYIVKN